MSTYTSSLGLEKITPGSQAGLWGNTTNNTYDLIDQAITGVTPISFASASGSTYTLTDDNGAANEARSAVLNVTGTAVGANTIIIPNKQKTYYVRNSTGKDIVVQTTVGTTPCTVGEGYNLPVFCDGNNNVFLAILAPGAGTLTVSGGGTGSTTFTAGFVKSTGGTNALTSSAAVALGSEVSGTLPVSNGGTGQTSLTSGALLFGSGTGAIGSLVGSASKEAPVWNGSAWASTGIVNSLTAGTNITITGGAGGKGDLTISASGGSGTVTSVNISGGTTGLTATGGPITSSGTMTLGGTLATANGGTGASSLTGAGIVTTGDTQTITGSKTFTGGLQSQAFNFATNTSFYFSSSIYLAINSLSYYQFNSAGTATAPAWVSTSDGRIKENVNTVQSALNNIATLRPVEYSMKVDNLSSANRYGFIAQELEQVYPNLVETSGLTIGDVENVKAVHYNDMIPLLVKAIQELKAEVDALKAAK